MIPIMLITDEIGGALIGGAGSLLTGGINAIAGAVQNRRQRQHDKEMLALEDAYADENATVAYQRQLDMWNKQNAYNDPSAQVARMRRAGLNPAMIQGSNMVNQAGAMSSAPQSSGGSGKSSQAQPIRFEDPFLKALSSYAQFKQLDLVDAQTKKTMQDAISVMIDNFLAGKSMPDTLRSIRAAAEKGVEDARAQRMENDLKHDAYFDEDGNIVKNPYTADMLEQKSRTYLNIANQEYIRHQRALTDAQIRKVQREVDEMKMTYDARIKTLYNNAAKSQADATIAMSRADFAELTALVSDAIGLPLYDLPDLLSSLVVSAYASYVNGTTTKTDAMNDIKELINLYLNKETSIISSGSSSSSVKSGPFAISSSVTKPIILQ